MSAPIRRSEYVPEHVPHEVVTGIPGGGKGVRAKLVAASALRCGVDEAGETVWWPFLGPAAHCVVTGPAGSGKTTVIRSVVSDAGARGMRIMAADPKRIELASLEGMPGVERIARTPEEIAQLVDDTNQLLDQRQRELEKGLPVSWDPLRPLLLVLDDISVLVESLNGVHRQSGGQGEHPGIAQLRRLADTGRAAGIHLLGSVQRREQADPLFPWGYQRLEMGPIPSPVTVGDRP